MNRREFLGAAAAVLAFTAKTGQGTPQRKPNILLILADDMGQHQVSCYGNPFYETPNIDRIAANGLKFTNGYAAAPVCSPTRASIMTGKYPARLHLTDYIPGSLYPYAKLKTPDWQKYLPVTEDLIPEMLAEAGYVSGHFGRWHLNRDKNYEPGRPGDPASQGFSDVLTIHKPNRSQAEKAGNDPDYDAHRVREVTDRAIDFMKHNAEKPFFCYVAHSSIHQPVMEYEPRVRKYADKPEAGSHRGNNPIIGAMVETMDNNVGRLLDMLEETGLTDNTLVVFVGDNGGYYGKQARKPLYGSKGDLYEGGVRVPFLMQWPGVIPEASECADLASTIDFLPTFAEMAGIAVKDAMVDGLSLMPAMTASAPLARDTLYWHYPHYHTLGIAPSGAIREGNYKLIEWFEKSMDGIDTPGALELFDLEKDPGESHDLAAEMPGKVRELYERLKAWRNNVGAQEMPLNPNYDPEHANKSL